MTRVLWTSTNTATAGSTVEMASMASTASKKLPPAPPISSGTSIPIRPSSKTRSISSGARCCSSSMARTFGAMACSANCRTVA